MRRRLLTLLCLLVPLSAIAQESVVEITGVIRDTEGDPLPGAIVELRHPEAKQTEVFGAANAKGHYRVRIRAYGEELHLEVGYIGYQTIIKTIAAKSQTIDLTLEESTTELQEVTVQAPRVIASNDTISYIVSQIKGKNDRAIEDVLKRLPGVTIDTDGMISYQGRPINKFYIEGLDLLGGQYSLATKNVRADDVASVQVYENHQPIKVLQGVERSESAALNIHLKQSAHMRPIGYIAAGSGYGDEALYRGELFGLLVGSKSQHLLTLKGNNLGDDYRFETRSHIQSIDAPSAPEWDRLSEDPMGSPSIPTREYYRNRSGLLSYNGITSLRSGTTLGVRAIADLSRIRYSQSDQSAFTTPDGIVAIDESETMD